MEHVKRTEGKLPSDYGMKDYFKFFQGKYGKDIVNPGKFNKIVSEINLAIIDMMLNEGFEYKMPYLNTTLLIKKDKRTPKLIDGKLYSTSPVNWPVTNKLWKEDPEAREKKILVRHLNNHTSGYVFRIYLKKFGCSLNNRSIFRFKPTRKFQRALGERIKDDNKDKFDTYLLY